jgi:thiol-disulfide isomerase/thioredoxin
MKTHPLPLHATAIAALVFTATSSFAQEFELVLQSDGAAGKLFSYYAPTSIQLSAERPAALTKIPADLRAPLFGALKLGPTDAPTSIAIIVDEPEGGEARLFLDSNANGDLTDDAPGQWETRPAKRRDGSPGVSYSGSGSVHVSYGAEKSRLSYKFYRFDKNDPARKAQIANFYYYRNHARIGDLTLDGKSYRAALSNDNNLADYRGAADQRAATLHLDLNGNGRFESETDRFPIGQPFNIGGKNYLASVLDAAGSKLRLEPSTVAAVERKSQSTGDALQSFTAKTTAGKEVNIPGDFKGQLVLLDFWATWCGPCIGELPNLTAAYDKFHARGFEVIGISLDTKPAAEVQQFADGKGMKWPQIVEGGGWQTRLAQLFNIRSIPKAILVDGTTGRIIADQELRGQALAPTIEKALATLGKTK